MGKHNGHTVGGTPSSCPAPSAHCRPRSFALQQAHPQPLSGIPVNQPLSLISSTPQAPKSPLPPTPRHQPQPHPQVAQPQLQREQHAGGAVAQGA